MPKTSHAQRIALTAGTAEGRGKLLILSIIPELMGERLLQGLYNWNNPPIAESSVMSTPVASAGRMSLSDSFPPSPAFCCSVAQAWYSSKRISGRRNSEKNDVLKYLRTLKII
jgi:hypothetical protein